MTLSRLINYAERRSVYLFQKITGYGLDEAFARDLSRQAETYLSDESHERRLSRPFANIGPSVLDLEDTSRYSLVRDDIYRRFDADESGSEEDRFGRRGSWIPRGCKIYFDAKTKDFVKVFDEHFCSRGEGAFLRPALDAGVYDFLCPNLSYIIQDDAGHIFGYAIREGDPLNLYEFEQYVGGALREVICEVTRRSGFYLYDLEFHNVIRSGNRLSLIDLESVLPIEWFGKGIAFAEEHLDVLDVGWPLNEKWRSPKWYRDFLVDLVGPEGIQPPPRRSGLLADVG